MGHLPLQTIQLDASKDLKRRHGATTVKSWGYWQVKNLFCSRISCVARRENESRLLSELFHNRLWSELTCSQQYFTTIHLT